MKKMIIIEDPKSCGTCPLHYEFYCPYLGRELGLWSMNAGKPTDCPLKPMPKKKTPMGSDIFNDYVRGYNECLEEIEKC